MGLELLGAIAGFLGVITGSASLLHTWYNNMPRIAGQIVNIGIGSITSTSEEFPQDIVPVVFMTYVVLTNRSRNPLFMLDFRDLEYDLGNGYQKLKPVYSIHKLNSLTFEVVDRTVTIPNLKEFLIVAQQKPLEYGIPTRGFVAFGSEEGTPGDFRRDDIFRWKMSIVDVFNRTHRIETKSRNFTNINLWMEMLELDGAIVDAQSRTDQSNTSMAGTILIPKQLPTIRGEGDFNYYCRSCHAVLVENVNRGQIVNIRIKCPQCLEITDIGCTDNPQEGL